MWYGERAGILRQQAYRSFLEGKRPLIGSETSAGTSENMGGMMESNNSVSEQRNWPWPASLDALIADPDHHRLLFENESVRVLDTRIAPGEITPIHTHQWASAFYVQSWSDFVRRDDEGNVALDSRQVNSLATPPKVIWSAPSPPHSLENVGTKDLWVIAVELKKESASETGTDLSKFSLPK